jgi:hypothetical protein
MRSTDVACSNTPVFSSAHERRRTLSRAARAVFHPAAAGDRGIWQLAQACIYRFAMGIPASDLLGAHSWQQHTAAQL